MPSIAEQLAATERREAVLSLYMDGVGHTEIAERLGISRSTVYTDLYKIRKMGGKVSNKPVRVQVYRETEEWDIVGEELVKKIFRSIPKDWTQWRKTYFRDRLRRMHYTWDEIATIFEELAIPKDVDVDTAWSSSAIREINPRTYLLESALVHSIRALCDHVPTIEELVRSLNLAGLKTMKGKKWTKKRLYYFLREHYPELDFYRVAEAREIIRSMTEDQRLDPSHGYTPAYIARYLRDLGYQTSHGNPWSTTTVAKIVKEVAA